MMKRMLVSQGHSIKTDRRVSSNPLGQIPPHLHSNDQSNINCLRLHQVCSSIDIRQSFLYQRWYYVLEMSHWYHRYKHWLAALHYLANHCTAPSPDYDNKLQSWMFTYNILWLSWSLIVPYTNICSYQLMQNSLWRIQLNTLEMRDPYY